MEKKLQRQIDIQLEKQKQYIIRKAKKLLNKKGLNEDADNLFNELDDQLMIDEIIVASGTAMKLGANYRIAKSKLGRIGISFDLDHPLAVEYLQTDRPLVLAKMKQTTKNAIKPILIDAAKTGQSPQATAKIISESFAFSKDRSLMIAVNEIGHAYGEGQYAVMKDVRDQGYEVKKYWTTARDDKVTPECAANENMGWIRFNKRFNSGDDAAPRDSHPRCRCDTIYEYE